MADAEDVEADASSVASPIGPLVFVSHDSRDAGLAEAFSKLLSSVSAGMLKTFRSSDRQGSQGMEYGVEWYPELMRNLQAANDVVCLLTARSLDRPWILYEAGVAKGKLDAPVHGLALGVPLSSASSGPFAQFQNCDDEVGSITKLVIQLVKRIPNADPDRAMVESQVEAFKTKTDEILEESGEEHELDHGDPASTARLFEEIKVMFSDLPARVERAAEGPDRERRMRRDPRMLDEMMMMGRHSEGPAAQLAMLSMFEEFTWLYDLLLLSYQFMVRGDTAAAARVMRDADMAAEVWMHGPMRRMSKRLDPSFMYEFIQPLLDDWRHMIPPEIEPPE